MNRHVVRSAPRIAAIVSLLSAELVITATANAKKFGSLAPGEAETFVPFAEGNSLEGIAIDKDTMYVGNRRETGSGFVSEILKITPNGDVAPLATFASPITGEGVLGLAIGHKGDVLAAVHSPGSAAHGVWRIDDQSEMVRLPGSEGMSFPNAIAIDPRGNLYVTDSVFFSDTLSGGIWRFTPGGTAELWIEDPLLAPFTLDPNFLFPPVGANGIAFHPGKGLYVANTQRSQIVNVPINADGTAGIPKIVAGDRDLLTDPFGPIPSVDGIAIDATGDIFGVLPAFAALTAFGLPTPPVVQVDPATGEVSRVSLTDYDGLFDFPLSLAFDGKSVFVTNGALGISPIPIPEPGPSIIEVGVGVRGFPSFGNGQLNSRTNLSIPEPATPAMCVMSTLMLGQICSRSRQTSGVSLKNSRTRASSGTDVCRNLELLETGLTD
jgi:sugar lactone lactonase YvrE